MLTIADKRGGDVSQVLTIADEGGGGLRTPTWLNMWTAPIHKDSKEYIQKAKQMAKTIQIGKLAVIIKMYWISWQKAY